MVVLGLPRGGVPVAFEVAQALDAPLDVIVVRKLGVPFQPELAMGAIGEDALLVVNDEVVRWAGVTDNELAAIEERERDRLDRRAGRYPTNRTRIPLSGRTAVVVDDGIAAGSTARAACGVARAWGATRTVLAVPVGPPSSAAELRQGADEVVCLEGGGSAAGCSAPYARQVEARRQHSYSTASPTTSTAMSAPGVQKMGANGPRSTSSGNVVTITTTGSLSPAAHAARRMTGSIAHSCSSVGRRLAIAGAERPHSTTRILG